MSFILLIISFAVQKLDPSIPLLGIYTGIYNSKRLMHNMYNKLQLLKILRFRDFLGGPVVKTLSTNAGGAGSILGWGAEILHAL